MHTVLWSGGHRITSHDRRKRNLDQSCRPAPQAMLDARRDDAAVL
jgi:hypothetical protein